MPLTVALLAALLAAGHAPAWAAGGTSNSAADQSTSQVSASATTSQLHKLLAQAEKLMDAGQFEAAREPLRQALALDGQSLRAHGLMGVVLQVEGQSEAAKAEYEKLQAGVLTGPKKDV
ncbi:MAG: hypothetical protein J7M26_01785, partial [Armatimonadetes bacterium]|nr:hypothetical protein [Armatimonadota bacterium]